MSLMYMGIDIGKTGGITVFDKDVLVFPMPPTEQDIMRLLRVWQINTKAIIEAQHAFPGMGAKAQWSFAQHYGFIRGCLVSLGIPFIEVSPQKWMAYFGFKRLKGEDKKKHKLRILQKAQNLYPQSTVNLQTADSLMIAEYGRIVYGNG